MTLIKKVEEAREYFEIEKYPSNFFEYIIQRDYDLERFGILLYRLNLKENLSGFIGYIQNFPVICINCRNTLGHQNFTLAHEVGHLFLHKGLGITDTTSNLSNYKTVIEREANDFASEFLYPIKEVFKDLEFINNRDLFNYGNELDLADYINELVNRYYVSFTFASNRILLESGRFSPNDFYTQLKLTNDETARIKGYVATASGSLSQRYGSYMYNPTDNYKCYQPYTPISLVSNYISQLVLSRKISTETAEIILNRFKELEGICII